MVKNHYINNYRSTNNSVGVYWFYGILFLMALSAATQAAAFYVSTQGSDSNPGTLSQPWRNIDYAAGQVRPGDTVYVRGGVYYETVRSRVSGTASQRITFKAYSNETPIIDGTATVTGWSKCTSSKDFLRPDGTSIGSLAGNSNYANIYKATVPVSDIGDPANVAIYEAGEYMYTSSSPIQTNNVFDDETTYKQVDSSCYGQSAYLIDSSLTQPDDFWNGATVKVWVLANNNNVSTRTVSDYIASQKKIVFNSALPANLSGSGTMPDAYALQNHWSLLNKKGTAYITTTPVNNRYTIYVWPNNPADIENSITVSKRAAGFWMENASYVTVDGFVIRGIGTVSGTSSQRSCGIGNAAGWAHTGLEVRNCTIKNSAGYGGISIWCGTNDIFENNLVENCRSGFGIAFQGRDYARNYDSIVRNNTVRNIRSTGLKIIYSSDIQITGNVGSEFGNHGNGCSLYQFNENVLFAHNRITNARNALTIKESKDVTIYCNILEGNGSTVEGDYILAAWSAASGTPMSGQVAILNNLILSKTGTRSLFISNSPQTQADWIIKNNVIDGFYWDSGISATTSHNLYVDYSWQQNSTSYKLGTGEYHYENYDNIFSNYDVMNYTHCKDGYAIGKGIGILEYLPTSVFPDYNFNVDIAGTPRNAADIADIGPYAASSTTVISPPTANAGSNQTVAYTDRDNIRLNGSQSTGTGTLTYEWSLDDSVIKTGVSPVISLETKGAGTYTIVLTVTDSQGQHDTDTVYITILESDTGTGQIDLRSGLVGQWQFSEGADDVAADNSEYANNARLSVNSMWDESGCIDFTSGDTYLTCQQDSSLNLTGSLTIAAWINPRSFGQAGYGRILEKGNGPAGRGFSLMLNGSTRGIGYMTYGGTYVSSTDGVIELNTWTHICAVYNRETQTVSFFINGQQAGSSAYTQDPADNTADPLYIGLRGYDGNRNFDGLMDDVTLYNRALNAQEVQMLYMKDSDEDLTALWRLNDLWGDSAQDSCDNHYTATLLADPEWGMPWKDGQEECLNFDGQSQAIEIATDAIHTDGGTIALTVTPFAADGMSFLFGHANDISTRNLIWLYTVSGKLSLGMGDNPTLSTNIATLKPGTLYHIALAWDKTDYFVYINGVLKDSGVYSGLTEMAATADVANMGTAAYRAQSLGFDGCIEDIRTYSRALSELEIAALANCQEVKANKKIEFYVSGEDINGNPCTYTAQNLPEGAVFDTKTQKFTWRPWYNQAGKYQVLFVSQDGTDRQILTLSALEVETSDWYQNFLSQNDKL